MTQGLPIGNPPPERIVSGSAGGGGAPGVGEVIVPNLAAASAVATLTQGQTVFVLSQMSRWRFDSNNTAPLSGAAEAPKVIASASPGVSPRLLRTEYADPVWRQRVDGVGVFAWQVDALAGNDENLGTPAAPLKTHEEWKLRIGNFGTWKLAGQTTLTYTSVAAMPPATDPLPLDDPPFVDTPFGGTPIFLTIQGPAYTAKAGHGGVVTAKVDRVRATNTENNVTTAGILDATDLGLRLQITAGARVGAMTYIDNITGANQANVSEWEIADLGPTTFADTHVFPSAVAADPTQVFLAGKLFINSARMRGGCQGSLLFKDLDIAPVNVNDPMQYFSEGAGIMWVRCRHVDGNAIHHANLKEGETGFFWGLIFELNCYAERNSYWRSGALESNIINGGLYHAQVVAERASVQFDADSKCANRPTFGFGNGVFTHENASLVVGAGSCFRASASGFNVAPASELAMRQLFYGVAAMYGQTNTVAGVQIVERLAYQAGQIAGLTVTGAGGDFQFNGAALAFWFDDATGVYQPPGGLASTWANLALASPAGLGGQAHSPKNKASITPLTAGLGP